jgi:hypothetical protein
MVVGIVPKQLETILSPYGKACVDPALPKKTSEDSIVKVQSNVQDF